MPSQQRTNAHFYTAEKIKKMPYVISHTAFLLPIRRGDGNNDRDYFNEHGEEINQSGGL